MKDKKILIALTPRDSGRDALTFAEKYIQGENLEMVLFLILDTGGEESHSDDVLDSFYLLCESKGINFRIRVELPNGSGTLANHLLFSDLLIVEHNGLNISVVNDLPVRSSCAVVAVPNDFETLSDVLLVLDDAHIALRNIRQFFQIFSDSARYMDVTLLWVITGSGAAIDNNDEIMLLECIRQHCKNIGMRKVQTLLNEKMMGPVPYNHHTIVVGNMEFLGLLGQACTIFNPLEDKQSAIFLSVK